MSAAGCLFTGNEDAQIESFDIFSLTIHLAAYA